MSQTKEDKLALEIAQALNDLDALACYQSFTKKYTEEFLKKVLMRVLSIPDDKIRRTRGALFTYLVSQNASANKNNSRD